tara:strand:- start:194 stop:628 length:435 start_codon:yes stop_codon:yes gene_type:complete
MKRINWSNLPPDPDGMTFADLKKSYKILFSQLEEQKRMRRGIEAVSKANRKDLLASRSEAKAARGQLVTLSRKQKARDEANKAGYWSGAAAITVTIFYEAFKVVGFPGGRAWAEFWGHEAVYGVIVWTMTMTFGWAYRATHSGS